MKPTEVVVFRIDEDIDEFGSGVSPVVSPAVAAEGA